MKSRIVSSFFLPALFLFEPAFTQPLPVSPRDSVKIVFDGKKVVVNYGKPSMRGRKIFGKLVRDYHVWRTGDGAATTLTTDMDLELDGAIVPRGTYTIYTLPANERWKLIINKQTGQWGTVYNAYLDLARVDLKITKLKIPLEELVFKFEKNGNNNGILKIEWENTSLSVPFHVSAEGLKASPRDSTVLYVDGRRIMIDYGSPSMRGREIMGSIVPYNVVWRTGANEATKFTVESDIVLGGVAIPSGSYTLYSLPSEKQWKLIVNKQTGQWGTVYNRKLDLARIPLKKKRLKEPLEKFTIKLENKSGKFGVMILAWEKTELSVGFRLK